MAEGPTGSVILDIYARGRSADPVGRAALLCAAGGGDASRMSIGDVDRTIWQWFKATFTGSHDAVMGCGTCGEQVEFTLPDDFEIPARSVQAGQLELAYRGSTYRLRLPCLNDVQGGALAREALADGAPWQDPGFEAAAQTALLEADPGLKVDLELACAACGAVQLQTLDVAGFAWARLEQSAQRVVKEVARLARAFGWSEAELTSMSQARRALWLAELGE
ncbi:MAG: hypothetical protein V2I24_07250 [Halieaceae bacterium]|jgi:hypothetical protein|nr:hypothetical protein [Halieaceae bacterium]